MRVCFVSGNIYPLLVPQSEIPVVGGAEVQQYLIGKGLAARGVDVSFVSQDFGQGAFAQVSPFRVYSYLFSTNKATQARTFWGALRHADADVYYVRGMPNYGLLIYFFCRMHRKKIVQALASDTEIMPEVESGLQSRWTYRIHLAWRRHADIVIAQSMRQQAELQARWGIRAVHIPSIVPLSQAKKEQLSKKGMTVLWVGRVSPVKRVELVPEVAARVPEADFYIAGGAGQGLEAYFDKVRAAANGQNVHWLGHVPYDQVDALFAQADVLLHTTDSNQEGFPNVFLQAWMHGLPVVSLGVDPDGLLERQGLGIRTASVEQAASTLEKLMRDPAERHGMSERARDHVIAQHSPEVILPRYYEAFSRLMEGR